MELANMCRVCLLEEDRVPLLDWHQLIDSLEYVISYKECFCKCTQINLSLKDDPSPTEDSRTQYLCLYCAQSLKDAHEFIEKAKNADNELRSRQIDKHFEWVTVSAKDVGTVLTEDPVVDDKNCLEEIKGTNIWHNQKMNEKGIYIADDIDEEEITIANLKKELESLSEKRKPATKTKRKRKEEILDEDTKSEDDGDDEDFIGDVPLVSSKESDQYNLSDKDIKKRVSKKKVKSKVKIKMPRKPKNNEVNQDEMVTCEVCKKVMTRKALMKHKYLHKPKIFLCKACPKTFSGANILRSHERTHDENRERFPCEICSRSFSTNYWYKEHLKTHDVNRKPTYKCTQCDKTFLQKNGLYTHRLHHEGPKWKCSFCDKRYVRQTDLKVHVRTHSGETPYQCNICDQSFIHKRMLTRHMERHGGFFRYTCLTCGEQFENYHKYKKHRQKHLGLPYKCGVCERQFNDSYKCKRHVRGVHKISESSEVEKLTMRTYDTKEYRGRIIEVIKNPEQEGI